MTNPLDTIQVTYTAREIKYVNEDLDHGREILTRLMLQKEEETATIKRDAQGRELTFVEQNQIDKLDDFIYELRRAQRDMRMATNALNEKIETEGPNQ